MTECRYLRECEFVLRYVSQVKPHWDDFVNLYCRGDLQGFCKRRQSFGECGAKPEANLMPTGHIVPGIIETPRE